MGCFRDGEQWRGAWAVADDLAPGQKEQMRLDQAVQDSSECSLKQNKQFT